MKDYRSEAKFRVERYESKGEAFVLVGEPARGLRSAPNLNLTHKNEKSPRNADGNDPTNTVKATPSPPPARMGEKREQPIAKQETPIAKKSEGYRVLAWILASVVVAFGIVCLIWRPIKRRTAPA